MTIVVTNWVRGLDLRSDPKTELMWLADHHSSKTSQCDPSVGCTAGKSGRKPRSARYNRRYLERAGRIIGRERRVLRDWSPDEVTRLSTLYAQTTPRLSEAEIAREMGRSKDAVQCKVWRPKLSCPSLRAQALSFVESRERGPPAVAQAA